MNFLTLTFLAFFSAVIFLYYILPKKAQNAVLLCANCVFYLWAGPALGVWLLGAVLLSFFCALAMERGRRRRLWLSLGVLALFGALFVFKYLDLAVRAVCALLRRSPPAAPGLSLPIGISFYSFTLAGYLFDVYRGKCKAEHELLRFAAFASLFPSLLSGPINRARALLPQLKQARRFDLEGFKAGLWRFLCGAGEKLVLANLLFDILEPAYASPLDYSGAVWVVEACLYSLYIYVDFSAYSDMALGAARMLGLELTENFRAPYFSRTVKEFWKKWHISLTSWFREYLYFPLGGSRQGKLRTWANILIVFAVSGLWHGAGSTFLIWGLLNGLYQVAGEWTRPARRRLRGLLHIPEDAWYVAAVQGLVTFGLITAAWIFFRAGSLEQAVQIFAQILRGAPGDPKLAAGLWPGKRRVAVLALSLALVGVKDSLAVRGRAFPIERTTFRFWTAAALLASAILLFGRYGPGFQGQDFVYFDF